MVLSQGCFIVLLTRAWLAHSESPKKQNVWVSCCSRFSKISAIQHGHGSKQTQAQRVKRRPRWKWDWWGICVTAEGGKTVALTITVMRGNSFIVKLTAIPDLLWEQTLGRRHQGGEAHVGRLESWLPRLIRDAFSDYSIYYGLNACSPSPPAAPLLPKSCTEALTLQCVFGERN